MARDKFKKGNQAAKKLKTEDMMKEAYRQYCEHIASGSSKEEWSLRDQEVTLTWRTMEKYIKENPSVLQPIQKEEAEAKSYKHWNELGKNMMLGKVRGCQPAIYQMFMRNKFGWDKENNVTHSFEPEVRKLLAKWEAQ